MNEIDLNGQVLHLTNTAVPVQITANKKSAEKPKPKAEEEEVPTEANNASNGNGVELKDADGAEDAKVAEKDSAEV